MENSPIVAGANVTKKNILFEVTTLSKTLTAVLFIILPFFGFIIGNHLASQNVYITDTEVLQNTLQSDNLQTAAVLASTDLSVKDQPNIGNIQTRFIVVNIAETLTHIPTAQITSASTSLSRLKQFIKKSSYGKAVVVGNVSRLYTIPAGTCNQSSYQENSNKLVQRSLELADADSKFTNYSHFIIYHQQPNCPDGITWTAEGYGEYKKYTINGRTIYLRGIRTSDVSDAILFHEFGHSMGSLPEKNIGHPDYLKCKVTKTSATSTIIYINKYCEPVFDFNSGILPIYDIMSGNQNVGLSDYGALTKSNIGWLNVNNLKQVNSKGTYKLSTFETNASGTKVLALKVTASTTAYFSFRQPIKYSTITKPGVVVEVISSERYSYPAKSFLVLDDKNYQTMMVPGIIYTLGSKKVYIKSLLSGSVEVVIN